MRNTEAQLPSPCHTPQQIRQSKGVRPSGACDHNACPFGKKPFCPAYLLHPSQHGLPPVLASNATHPAINRPQYMQSQNHKKHSSQSAFPMNQSDLREPRPPRLESVLRRRSVKRSSLSFRNFESLSSKEADVFPLPKRPPDLRKSLEPPSKPE